MSQVSAQVDGSKQPVDRRAHARQFPRSLAYVELGEGNGGIVLNVSEGGIAVQAVVSLMGDELPCVRVQLAHSQKTIEAKGRITWTAGLRKTAGVEFVDLSREARSLLREWVALENPSAEFVEEMTEPISEGASAASAQHPMEPAGLNADSASLKPNSATKPAELPPELEQRFKPVPSPTAPRGLSAFDAISAATAEVAPASSAASEATRRAGPARETPATSSAAIAATSTPLVAEPEPSSPAARTLQATSRGRSGLKPSRAITDEPAPAAVPREQRWKLPVLVAVFAAISLAVGWFAGHGALHDVSPNAQTDTSSDDAAPDNSAGAPPTAPDVSNIEVVDLNNQRWLVPMQGPLGPSQTSSASSSDSSSTQFQKDKMTSDAALPAPARQEVQAVRREEKARAAVLPPPSGLYQSISPANAATDSRPAMPAQPPVVPTASQQAVGLQPGALLHRVEPVYPQAALAQGVEGTVILHAVIDADGSVKSLESLNGPSALIPAAIAAVRQWRYSPSLLNGRPIQTERQIKIVFQLSQSQ